MTAQNNPPPPPPPGLLAPRAQLKNACTARAAKESHSKTKTKNFFLFYIKLLNSLSVWSVRMLLYDNCWSQVAFHCSFYSAQALSRSSRLGQTSAAIASSAIRSFATTSVICQPSVPIPLVNLTCRGFQRFCPFVQPRPGILRRACSRTIHQSLPLHIECGQV